MASKEFKKRRRNQRLAKFVVNLAFISYGLAVGWPSPSFLILKSEKTPLDAGPLEDDELAWINSILSMGALFGTIIFYSFSYVYGRKKLLCILTIPQIASWVIVIYAKRRWHLFASRALAGLGVGGSFVLVPLFIEEISEEELQPKFGACLLLSTNIGFFIAFLAGNLLPYRIVPMIFVVFPIIFLLGMLLLPESPVFLMMNERMEEAEKSLRFYRNIKQADNIRYFSEQLELLQRQAVNKCSEYVIPYRWEISTKEFKRGLLFGIILLLIQELSGCFTMLSYMAIIFDKSGTLTDPENSVLTVGIIQLIGSILSLYVIERVSRKRLMDFSLIGICLSLLGFGTFSLLYDLKWDVGPFSWATVFSFSTMLFSASFGILPLPLIILTEIIPKRVSNFGISICFCCSWLVSFITTRYFELFINTFGLYSCLYGFAICSFFGFLFVKSLPEKMNVVETEMDEDYEVDDSSPIFEIF